MKFVKVRRAGNSTVSSLPRALQGLGYSAGETITVDELPNGELRLVPTRRAQAIVRALVHDIVTENRQAMDMLAAYDRNSVATEAVKMEVQDLTGVHDFRAETPSESAEATHFLGR